MSYPFLLLPLALILDALLGDPSFPIHPVILMGRLISLLEKILLPPCKGKRGRELAAGAILTLLTCLICGLLPLGIFWALSKIHPLISLIAKVYTGFILLAGKSLYGEARRVYGALKEEPIEKAREALSRIVGRDTESLSREGVIRAAVETVAENTNDGIIAPLFYLSLFGPVGMCVYKAINTLDSMVGYKNEKYLYFGRASARLDDIAGFLPARLSALFMILSCPLCGMDMKGALRIFLRDRYKHASPNSAQTEAVMAGALGIRLAGPASYFGKPHEKPYIGDAKRPAQEEDILRAGTLMWVSEALGCLVFMGLAMMVRFLCREIF